MTDQYPSNEQVAAVALAAIGPMSSTVAAHFNVSRRHAFRLLAQARRAGHLIPITPRGTSQLYDREEVTRVALQAYTHRPMSIAVADHFNIPRRTATSLLSRCRQEGYQIPNDLPSWSSGAWRTEPTNKKAGPVSRVGFDLVCGCGQRCGLDALALADHTLRTHGRRPTDSERTPQQVEATAAA
jgi:transposase